MAAPLPFIVNVAENPWRISQYYRNISRGEQELINHCQIWPTQLLPIMVLELQTRSPSRVKMRQECCWYTCTSFELEIYSNFRSYASRFTRAYSLKNTYIYTRVYWSSLAALDASRALSLLTIKPGFGSTLSLHIKYMYISERPTFMDHPAKSNVPRCTYTLKENSGSSLWLVEAPYLETYPNVLTTNL